MREGNDQPFFTITLSLLNSCGFSTSEKNSSLASSSHLFVIDACVVQISGQAAKKNQQKTKKQFFTIYRGVLIWG